jgi:Tfp pilus assembly protein PilP
MRAFVLAVVLASSAAALEAQAPAKSAAPAAAQPAAQKPATPPPAAPAQPPAGPAQAPAPGAPAQPAGQPPPPKAAGEGYTYDADNRRDPFISLVGTGLETTTVVKKGEGPAGMLVSEISVRGIMQSKGAYVAMVEGPDKKTYVVHSGDRLADGTIKNIIPTGLIIIQEVNDPLSLVKQREVRKLLRSLEDAKE